jgi:2-polyprenyl-6-methoxyphenol hydroxylase-like FAD-dependent oxidoreductase
MSDMQERIAALPVEKREILFRHLKKQNEQPDMTPNQYDVALLGGGMAGLTLALQIKKTRPGARVVVIERQKYPVPEAAHKVGESTVEIASRYLRDVLGLQEHLQTQQLRKFGLRMFFKTQDNYEIVRRVELGSTIFPPLSTY